MQTLSLKTSPQHTVSPLAALLLGETLSEDLIERYAVDKTGKPIQKSTFDILAELV